MQKNTWNEKGIRLKQAFNLKKRKLKSFGVINIKITIALEEEDFGVSFFNLSGRLKKSPGRFIHHEIHDQT